MDLVWVDEAVDFGRRRRIENDLDARRLGGVSRAASGGAGGCGGVEGGCEGVLAVGEAVWTAEDVPILRRNLALRRSRMMPMLGCAKARRV